MEETVSSAFEKETIRRAERGDRDAALLALQMAVEKIEARILDTPLLDYLTENLRLFLDEQIPIDTALGVEAVTNTGGRPRKYVRHEIAAADLLLRDHAGFKLEEANDWISENIGPNRRYIQERRKRYDARYNDYGAEKLMESRSMDYLLDLAGSLREKVAGVLPQT